MKKLRKATLTLIAAALTIFATSISSVACAYFLYQPKEPKCLRGE